MFFALCDSDAGYLERFMKYVEEKANTPFEMMGFTDVKHLAEVAGKELTLSVLVVSEELYEPALEKLATKTLVLDEGGGKTTLHALKVDKFQQVREIYKMIIELCLQEKDISLPTLMIKKTRVLGFYSPIKRAMQTSFALALGRSLATRYKVLYLSFEPYAGWNGLLCREGGKDLFDLLYYLKETKERFLYRFEQVERKVDRLCYVPPVHAGQNLVYVTTKEWLLLLSRLTDMGKFDFILLDLSDSLQGIFEILRSCEKVFTVVHKEAVSVSKVEQYEYLLRMYECDDVLEKTIQKKLPEFEAIPDEGEWWTFDNWKQFIRKIEEDDLGVVV